MMFHLELLNINVTVSPGAFNVILVWPLKLVGVIVIAFVPDVAVSIIVLICPSAPCFYCGLVEYYPRFCIKE